MLDIGDSILQDEQQSTQLEIIYDITPDYIVLDIRSQDERERHPLVLDNISVKSIPFYNLYNQFPALDQSKHYLLYCDHGIMSRLQALYLREYGFNNVNIYSHDKSKKTSQSHY